MYVCMYVCMRACVRACVRACQFFFINWLLSSRIFWDRIKEKVPKHQTRYQIFINSSTYVCMYVCVCVCACVRACILHGILLECKGTIERIMVPISPSYTQLCCLASGVKLSIIDLRFLDRNALFR